MKTTTAWKKNNASKGIVPSQCNWGFILVLKSLDFLLYLLFYLLVFPDVFIRGDYTGLNFLNSFSFNRNWHKMLRKVHVFKTNLKHNKNHSYPLVITYKQYWGGDETPTGSPIKPGLLPQHHLNVRGQPVITLNYNKNLDTAKPVFTDRHYRRGNCNGKDRISDNTAKKPQWRWKLALNYTLKGVVKVSD